jgi:flagellar motor switch protein FliM
MMIDASCGHDPNVAPPPRKLTDEEKEMCSQLGRDVLSDLRYAYPEVVKTRPTTWPLHLRNTISIKAEMMLREYLENAQAKPCRRVD